MPLQHPILGNRSWYANGMGVQIVAVEGAGTPTARDWAAYIGGVSYSDPEDEAMKWVRQHGCKLTKEEAEFFFPHIAASDLHYRK